MNIVFIIPTGIGCEIGGHAGDANPAVKLVASLCDKLITHPNAVNASDINEMTENSLYVEGSILDRFLWGQIYLEEVPFNRILLAVNPPLRNETVNAVNAARATIGADVRIIVLDVPLRMEGRIERNRATGDVRGWESLVDQVAKYDFDALAIATPVEVDREVKFSYFERGGINPWGGIEAIVSKLIADKLDKPVAHAPVQFYGEDPDYDRLHETLVCDPRMAAEMVSVCYLHCVFKGLHKAPRVNYERGLSVDDIDLMISPICYGEPHLACKEARIPIIFIKENRTCMPFEEGCCMKENDVMVNSYLEAAGRIVSMRAGISPDSVRRPLRSASILNL